MVPARPQEFSRVVRYHLLRAANPGRSARWCADRAGYSPSTKVAHIEASAASLAASRTIDQQRDDLARVGELSIMTVATQAAGIALGTTGSGKQRQYTEKASDRLKALRLLVDVAGYNAPERVDVQSRALILELAAYGRDDLQAVQAFLHTEGQV